MASGTEAVLNTAEKVVHHFKWHPNLVFCDDFLKNELRLRKSAYGSLTRMLDVLNKEYFHRAVAICHLCGEDKVSIEQVRQFEVSRRSKVVQNS